MGVLRNIEVYRHIEHALSGKLGDEIQPFDVLEQAADWLSAIHSWRFLRARQVRLKVRGTITTAAATCTYTHATRTLTDTAGPFAAYEFLAGDVIDVTGASAGALKEYAIESRTDADSIVLKSPGPGANATGVAGKLSLASVALPADFMQAVAVSSTNSVVNGIKWTTPDDLLRKRTSQIDVSSSWNYYGALTWAKDADDAAVPILDIWPTPTADDEDAFTLFYRRRIAVKDEDTAVVPIPADAPNVKLLLIRAARAIALGYEEGEEGGAPSMDLRLLELQAGPIFRAAIRQDGLGQPTMGPLKGGAVQRMPRGYRQLLSSQVDAPT